MDRGVGTHPAGPTGQPGPPHHVKLTFLALGAALLAFITGLLVLVVLAGLDDWDSLGVLIVSLVAVTTVIVGMFVFAGTLYLALMTALFGWRRSVRSAVELIVALLVGFVVISYLYR